MARIQIHRSGGGRLCINKVFKYLTVFIILCFLADSGINYSIAKQIDNQSPYCLSFASIGANLLESRLDCWAKIKSVNTFAEMDQALIKILDLLDLPVNQPAFIHQTDDGKLTLSYQVLTKNTNYLITLQSEKQISYFILTAVSSQDDLKLRSDEKLLKNTLSCKSYFRYKGVIEACPDKDGREKILQVVSKCFKARKLDYYEERNLLSIAAFSPKLEEKYDQVELAGKTYNLQMAICNDNNKNQSYIYLGIPLLLNEY